MNPTPDSSASFPTSTPPATPDSAHAPRLPSLLRHAVNGLALFGLACALTLILALWLLSLPPLHALADAYGNLAGRLSPDPDNGLLWAARVLNLSLFLAPLAFVVLAWRLRLRSPWWVGGGWLAVLPVLAYLAADEPSRRTIKLEEMAPAFPGAEKSYAVLMRYGKNHPSPESLAFDQLKLKLVGLPASPDQPAPFAAFLSARRADIESDWAALAPQRRWLDELNAFDRIGDLGTADIAADIVRFNVWRTLSQRAAAQAGLLALAGRGDDALALLLPVLEAGRKLEPSGRTLVRLMTARTVQQVAIDAAAFTLARSPVSPAHRTRLASALTVGVGGEPGARRLVSVDYALTAGWLETATLGDIIHWDRRSGPFYHLLNVISPFVFNPQRTLNLYGDLIGELQDLAARRESGKINLRDTEFWTQEGRPTFKNFGGRMVSRMVNPSLSKVVERYWKIEDKRLALLATLATP